MTCKRFCCDAAREQIVIFPAWTCKCGHRNECERQEAGDPPVCFYCGRRNPDFKYPRKRKANE